MTEPPPDIIHCGACQRRHHRLMQCRPRVVLAPKIDLAPPCEPPIEPSEPPNGGSQVVHKSRHGMHLNTDERKAYRRAWMRRKRAG